RQLCRSLAGVRLGGGAVFGGAAGPVVEQGGRGDRLAARGAQAPPQGAHDGDDGGDDDGQAQGAARGGGGGGLEEVAHPVPEGVEGLVEPAGVVLVVHALGQFAPGGLPRGVAGEGDGRFAAARQDAYGGAGGRRQRLDRGEDAPRGYHPVSPPGWRRGRGRGGRRRGPGRGRGPRGGCAGRCRAAR